ncbi:MAG: Maf family protein [Treponema sp.]|jgi:septum formation protein|nr:Maf family protein [Treponema sp.]
MEPIILASGSLRRQEYLRLLGLPFSIMPSHIEESLVPGLNPEEQAEKLAADKVRAVMETLKSQLPQWILGADTLISIDGEILGKPIDREDARQMLLRYSNRSHEVITSMSLYNGKTKTISSKTVKTIVTFAEIAENELEWYLNTGEWQGAAGSYKIQGLASCFVSKIDGSFSNVVGLPIHDFYGMLKENDYPYGL